MKCYFDLGLLQARTGGRGPVLKGIEYLLIHPAFPQRALTASHDDFHEKIRLGFNFLRLSLP